MRRTYSNQEMTRILQQELVIPEQVDRGMQDAYMKLGIKLPKKTSFSGDAKSCVSWRQPQSWQSVPPSLYLQRTSCCQQIWSKNKEPSHTTSR